MSTMHPLIRSWLDGLAAHQVVLLQLAPEKKISTKAWNYFLDKHDEYGGRSRLDLAERWLGHGFGLGYLPRNGLWVLDCDSPETICQVEAWCSAHCMVPPKLVTPSGGAHFIFRFPPTFEIKGLKNHVCHPRQGGFVIPWDFKLGERTMLVAPGTQRANGTYMPTAIWTEPPILDPRDISPGLEIYRESVPFLVNERAFPSRVRAGQVYVGTKAPVSISGEGGSRTLRTVAAHLVAYHQLDPAFAFYLLTKPQGGVPSWNSRCRDLEKNPCPWSAKDLYRALERAVDDVPAYGVLLYRELEERQHMERVFSEFWEHVLASLDQEAAILSRDLWSMFLDFAGFEDSEFSQTRFGTLVEEKLSASPAEIIKRLATRQRLTHYRGVNGARLRERLQRVHQVPSILLSAS